MTWVLGQPTLLPEEQERLLAAAHPADLESPALQALDQGFDEILLVIDHQHPGPGMHGHDLNAVLFTHDVSPAEEL
jgi:hypothetical protein